MVVQRVFEGNVTVSELLVELVLGFHGVEVEGIAGGEDDDLFGEVAVVWVIQTVWKESV
jgi:hypothetical protein